jgi:hypothetical protein
VSAPEPRAGGREPALHETSWGAGRSSVTYAELPSAGAIPSHFDTANEVFLVLDGPVEIEVAGNSPPA